MSRPLHPGKDKSSAGLEPLISKTGWARYVVVFVSVAVATLLMFALYALLDIERGRSPFIFFFGAVIVSALYGGRGPALLSIILSAIVADYFFIPPFGLFSLGRLPLLQLCVFVSVSLFIAYLADRTRRAEIIAQQNSESLAATLLGIGDGVIATDAEGRITLMNGVAETLTGWTLDEARARDVSEIFRIVNEQTREPVESPVAKVLREGGIAALANHTVLISKSGAEIPIDDSGAPVHDRDGRVVGVVLVFRDVSERRQAEQELRRRERELTDFVENATVGLHWVGADGTILWANRAELEMLGYSAQEYIGHNIAEFHADPQTIKDILERLSGKETLNNYEARLRCKDGSIRHTIINSNVLWDDEGRFIHTRCFTRDVTERKEVEVALARLAAIVESSEDAIIGKTLDGTITSWNKGAERVYGYRSQEAVGRHISMIAPAELADELEDILLRLGEGERIEHLETERVRKGGERINVSLSISPITDANGRVTGASTIARDITERKRAEEERAHLSALVELERERLRNLVRNVPGVVWEAWGVPDEAEQRMDFVSDHVEQMLGYTVEEWLRTPNFWLTLVHKDDRERAAREAHQIYESRQGGTTEFRWVARDGRIVYVEAHSRVILDRRGVPVGMRGVTMDVTARKQAEQQMSVRTLRLELLSEAAALLLTTEATEEIIRTLYAKLAEPFGLTAYFNYMVGEAGDALYLDSCAGVSEEFKREYRRLDFNRAICGTAAQERRPIYVADIQSSDYEKAALVKSLGIRAYACTPLIVGNRLLGTFSFASHKRDHFEPDEIEFFSTVSHYIAMAKERLRLLDELRTRAKSLAESEQHYRALADAMPQIVWTARADGFFDYYNRRWFEYTGMTLEQTEGWGWQPVLHPDDVENCLHHWATALQTGQPYNIEYRFRRASDGQYRWHLSRAVPLRDAAGQVVKWFGTSTDIHDQKQATERARFLAEAGAILAASLDYEQTLERLARLGVMALADYCLIDTVDETGCVERVATLHVDPSAKERVRLLRAYPPDMTKDIGIARVLRRGRPEVVHEVTEEVLKSIARDEQHRDILRSLGLKSFLTVPLIARERTVGALTFSSTAVPRRYDREDIEFAEEFARRAALAIDNAALYRKAQEVNRAKDEFLATLSHELRTPLTPIIGWTHLLREGRLPDSEVAHGISIIEKNAESLTRLINDLLDMSAILSGKMGIERALIDLAEVLQEAVETVRPQAEKRNVRIEVADEGEQKIVSGDRVRLVQLFWNLLTNAVNFSNAGNTVRVSCEVHNEHARVVVADEGAGISSDFLPYVFERFRQADSSTTRAHGGLGIGLALVKSFAEAHDGSVAVESEGVGRGSRFIISLPLLETPNKLCAAGNAEARAIGAMRDLPSANLKAHILLIEDSRDTLDMLRVAFAARGFETTLCESADEALRVARTLPCDIIVSDIGLPQMNGYELIARLRQMPHLHDVPAVALTGYAATKDAEDALSAGFQLHIPKPVDPGLLAKEVSRILDERRAQDN